MTTAGEHVQISPIMHDPIKLIMDGTTIANVQNVGITGGANVIAVNPITGIVAIKDTTVFAHRTPLNATVYIGQVNGTPSEFFLYMKFAEDKTHSDHLDYH